MRYLRENEGRAPPIILAVGDRRRVNAIARKLRKPVFLPETAAKLSNPRIHASHLSSTIEFGRVAMVIGDYKSVPVLVVETQMGAPAIQVIMSELLSDDLTSNEYKVGGNRIDLKSKIIIRIGTAGGINCNATPPVKVGDVVNATHSIGATGAIMQSILRLEFWHPESCEAFRARWMNLGSDFTYTSTGYPRVKCSGKIVEAIEAAAGKLPDGVYQSGGNITKDSLYAELSDETFLNLCRTENCRTTEMELSAIAVCAREHSSAFGMTSAIVGTLPGSSFAEDEKLKLLAEKRAIEVGLESIRNMI
jgi:uridine phosphorylase